MRQLPLDMYVTNIKVRTPGAGDWVRIEKCQYSNRDHRMTTEILFNDLTVSGTVQLLDDSEIRKNSPHPIPREFCQMSLRFQRAGMDINAFPTRGRSRGGGVEVRTETRFLDPQFLSVHAHGCKLNDIFKRRERPIDNSGDMITSPGSDISGEYKEPSIFDNLNTDFMENNLNFSRKIVEDSDNSPSDSRFTENSEEPLPKPGGEAEVRIITLHPDLTPGDDSTQWYSLHREKDTNFNDFHRHRLLGTRLHTSSERERLKAVLHVQNLIAQQANHVFQTQGPFSHSSKPLFKPFEHRPPRPKPLNSQGMISSITELDENLSPIRPVPQKPFHTLFHQNNFVPNGPNNPHFNNYYEAVSREMEDIFLRGIKTLLTRYVEKQLELPLKEALMVNIGYTVSYG